MPDSEDRQEILDNHIGFRHLYESRASKQTLLLLHGTGGDEYDLIELGQTVAPDANLLSPRGKVLENGRVNRFFRRLAEGVFDEQDIKFRAQELAEFVGSAAEHYGFDSKNVWALGFSNGANIATALMLLHPEILCGAILLSPMLPLVPEAAPNLKGVPVFIGAGNADAIATPTETTRLAELLKSYGAVVATHFYPTGHTISRAQVDDVRDWIAAQA